MYLLQLYAILSMDLFENPSNVSTSMLQVTVSTMPADTMLTFYIPAIIDDEL
jgi:hypothetical protein